MSIKYVKIPGYYFTKPKRCIAAHTYSGALNELFLKISVLSWQNQGTWRTAHNKSIN